MIRNYMIENADALKARAVRNRSRGYHTGKSAAGWDAKRADPAKGSFDRAIIVARSYWDCAKSEAHNDYLRAVFPERFDDVTLDDVIAANDAAARDALLGTF
jgi:hypothetical protein